MAGYALGGGLIGGIVGAVGGAIEASQQRAQAARLRRRFSEGVRKGESLTQKEVYDVLQSPEFQTVRSFALNTYGVENPGNAIGGGQIQSFGGRDFLAAPTGRPATSGDKRVAAGLAKQVDEYLTTQRQLASGVDSTGRKLTDAQIQKMQESVSGDRIANVLSATKTLDNNGLNELSAALGRRGVTTQDYQALAGRVLGEPQMAAATLGGTPGGIVETPLTRAFRGQVAVAQTSRGIYNSQAAAAAEASGLAAFQYQQQQNMLPFLLQTATFGNDIYHKYETANIGREVQKATGGVGVYGASNPFQNGPSVVGSAFNAGLSGVFSGASLGVQLSSYLGSGQQAPTAQPRYGQELNMNTPGRLYR